MQSVLIVDDERNTREGLSKVLGDSFDVFAAANADDAIRMLDAEHFDAVITDLRMSGKSGMSVIDKAISLPSRPVCIMLTAYGNVEMAVEAMKRGATDFISKPIDVDKLEKILKGALEKRTAAAESSESAKQDAAPMQKQKKRAENSAPGIIAKSPKMREVIEQAEQVAASKATVMLTGETGTGKELIARLIHDASPRKDNPFLPVHCAAIPANLLESELFGYERGAFTGAVSRRIGRFEAADKGTIFLDEIGEIDAPTQVKLLRFLETHSFERLGGQQNISVDVRVVCATNKNLREMADKGEFREDLFYRLNVVEIKVPPLREHSEDIVPLLDHYVNFYAEENGVEPVAIEPAAMKILKEYRWPGNIRELRNFCENIVVMHKTRTLSAADLDPKFSEAPAPVALIGGEQKKLPPPSLDKKENETDLIRKALEASGGNKSKAAELLGISRRTLHRKLAEME